MIAAAGLAILFSVVLGLWGSRGGRPPPVSSAKRIGGSGHLGSIGPGTRTKTTRTETLALTCSRWFSIVVSLRFFLDTEDPSRSLPRGVVGAERRMRPWRHMVPPLLTDRFGVQVGLLEVAFTFQYLVFDVLYMRA